jgi:hypothetical protein
MKTDILIRSYHKDYEWLWHSLRSIRKFGRDFSNIHIIVPELDVSPLNHLTREKIHTVVDQCEGYLAQQITKVYADTWCNSDYVLHVDSDCIFYTNFSPESFFIDNKPVMLYEKPKKSPWNEISEKTLGWYDEYEYMRRHPIIYPRWIYAEFRRWIKEKHGCELDAWICAQPDRKFSEFNTLGQWARKYFPDEFVWMNPHDFPRFCKQYWSWGGITDTIQYEIDQLLA